jgi:hypothetical protein
VLTTAKHKINWEMRTLAELKPLYEKVMGFLKTTKHGEFLAMRELFGEVAAVRVAMKGDMKVPGYITSAQKKAIIEEKEKE